MKLHRTHYLIAGSLFALCAANHLLTSAGELFMVLRETAYAVNTLKHMLQRMLLWDLPFILLALYCFFLRQRKSSTGVFSVSFALLAVRYLLLVMQDASLAVLPAVRYLHQLDHLSYLFFILFCIATALMKPLKSKIFVVAGGIGLVSYLVIEIFANIRSFRLLPMIPMEPRYLIIILSGMLLLVFQWVAFSLLWWLEAIKGHAVSARG